MKYPCDGILLGHNKEEILTHVTIWMKSEDAMLSEVSQLQENKQAHCEEFP